MNDSFVWAKRRVDFSTQSDGYPTRDMAVEQGFLHTNKGEVFYTGRLYEFRFAAELDMSLLLREFERKSLAAGVPYRELAVYIDGIDLDDADLFRKEVTQLSGDIFPAMQAITDIEWHWHIEMEEGKEGHPLMAENRELKKVIERLNRNIADMTIELDSYNHYKRKESGI